MDGTHTIDDCAKATEKALIALFAQLRLQRVVLEYLILKPNVSVATAAVFQDPELTRNSSPITIAGFLSSGGRNDCEPIVRRRYPEVARALDWLGAFGTARLTGTGSCVFVDCETMERGRELLRQVPPTFEGYLARGLNDSPLLARLAGFGSERSSSR